MFKVDKIIQLFKGKNKDKINPTNYRGITLTSALSKLFEKVILSYMKTTCSMDKSVFHNPLSGKIVQCFYISCLYK